MLKSRLSVQGTNSLLCRVRGSRAIFEFGSVTSRKPLPASTTYQLSSRSLSTRANPPSSDLVIASTVPPVPEAAYPPSVFLCWPVSDSRSHELIVSAASPVIRLLWVQDWNAKQVGLGELSCHRPPARPMTGAF